MKMTKFDIHAYEIKGAPRLDPIRFYMQDIGSGQGRLTVECFGRAWCCFWPSMETGLWHFIMKADAEYIENALHYGQRPKKGEREYLQRIIKAIQTALRESA